MKNKSFTGIAIALLLITVLTACKGLSSDKVRRLTTAEQEVKARWADIENQYQRRADIFMNIIASVKRIQEIDNPEQQSQALKQLQAVANDAKSLNNVKVDIYDEQSLNNFITSQDKLRDKFLFAIDAANEALPQLKTKDLYMNYLTQIEGVENRILSAKNSYISASKDYNTLINEFGKEKALDSGFKELPLFQSKDYTTPNLDY